MSSNGSNSTNATRVNSGGYTMPIMYAYYTSEICYAVVGTFLNLWFLVAILTSREMRSRLRNMIICNSLVLLLLDSVLVLPMKIFRSLSNIHPGCAFLSVTWTLQLIQDFIVNWLVVMILVVFIAQIQDFNPRTRLTPMAATLGTVGLLVLPWVASLVVVPIIVHDKSFMVYYARVNCFYPSKDAYQILKPIDTSVPILLAVLLLIVAAALMCRQGNSSGSMQAELISSQPEIDSTLPYVAAVAVCIFCDLIRLIMSFDVYIFKGYNLTWVNLHVTALIMSDARIILMTLPWLLLHDVRQRVRTWRPWHCSAPVVDLTVTYKKEEI